MTAIEQFAEKIQAMTDFIREHKISERLIEAAQTNTGKLKQQYTEIQNEFPELFSQIDEFCEEYKKAKSPKVFYVYPCDFMPLDTEIESQCFEVNEDLVDFDPEKIRVVDLTILLALTNTRVADNDILDGKVPYKPGELTVLEGLLRRAGYEKLSQYAHYYAINWLEDLRQAYCAKHLPLYNDGIIPQSHN